MRVRAAHEIGIGRTHEFDVIDVAALASDEPPVFLAQHTCANTFNTHRISPCRTASPARKFSKAQLAAGFLISKVQTAQAADHSAACATFMRPAASSTDLTILW